MTVSLFRFSTLPGYNAIAARLIEAAQELNRAASFGKRGKELAANIADALASDCFRRVADAETAARDYLDKMSGLDILTKAGFIAPCLVRFRDHYKAALGLRELPAFPSRHDAKEFEAFREAYELKQFVLTIDDYESFDAARMESAREFDRKRDAREAVRAYGAAMAKQVLES